MYKKVIDKLVEKKLLVVAILLFLAINIIVAYNSFSEKTTSSIWDGKIAESFSDGTGSVEDPYIINSGAEFAYFMQCRLF